MKTLIITDTPQRLEKIKNEISKETVTITVPKIHTLDKSFEWDRIYCYRVPINVMEHIEKTLKAKEFICLDYYFWGLDNNPLL